MHSFKPTTFTLIIFNHTSDLIYWLFSSHPHEPTGEEDKHLVRGVIVVGDQHGEVCPPGPALAGLVSELTLELVQRLVQLVLGHQVAPVMAQLEEEEEGHGGRRVIRVYSVISRLVFFIGTFARC